MASGRGRGRQQNNDQRRFALLDLGFPAGEDFCRELLLTPDFNLSTLSPFAKGESKSGAASAIARKIAEDELNPEELVLAYCQQPRQWLSIRVAESSSLPELSSAKDFLTRFGPADSWYGPFADEGRSWYVHAAREKHYIMQDGGQAVPQKMRWHVVAEVAERYVALHWNNFTHADLVAGEANAPTRLAMVQFPYWCKIPGIFDSLAEQLGITYTSMTPLHRVVLRTLMQKFDGKVGFDWKHLRIRAERDGVALNAHSAGAREVNVNGLQALTKALAKSVAKLLPTVASHEAKIEKQVLLTLLHEWGTKSYEFSLDEGEDRRFKAHCYFGTNLREESPAEEEEEEENGDGWRSKGPDDFPHLKCYQDYGGSLGARDFLLPYLLPR